MPPTSGPFVLLTGPLPDTRPRETVRAVLREGPGPHHSDVDSLWLRPGEEEAGGVQKE